MMFWQMNSDGTSETGVKEMWSDAARAASAAARKARGGIGSKKKNWKDAGRAAFAKSKGGQDAAVKSVVGNRKKADAATDNKTGDRLYRRANTKAKRFAIDTEGGLDTLGARKILNRTDRERNPGKSQLYSQSKAKVGSHRTRLFDKPSPRRRGKRQRDMRHDQY